jgi:hypothetical protein
VAVGFASDDFTMGFVVRIHSDPGSGSRMSDTPDTRLPRVCIFSSWTNESFIITETRTIS